jgi:hypothetical protein
MINTQHDTTKYTYFLTKMRNATIDTKIGGDIFEQGEKIQSRFSPQTYRQHLTPQE